MGFCVLLFFLGEAGSCMLDIMLFVCVNLWLINNDPYVLYMFD